MTDKEVKAAINRAVNETVQRLKAEGIIRSERKTPLEKVEELLRDYPAFKRVQGDTGVSRVCAAIEAALKSIQTDPYYTVIERYYFEGQTRDMIALSMKTRPETISRNKKRLLRQIAPMIVAGDVLQDILT